MLEDSGAQISTRRCPSTSIKKTFEASRWVPFGRVSIVWWFRPRKENAPAGYGHIFLVFLALPDQTIILIVLYKSVSTG